MKKALLLTGLLLTFLAGCSSEDASTTNGSSRRPGASGAGAQNAEVAMSVEGHKVTRRSISEYVITNTSLESIRDVMVYSRINATITERMFEEGDVVKEGDILVKLHDDEIINNLEQSRIDLAQAEVAVEQAEVNAELSAAEFERVKSLHSQQLISQQEYDQSEIASRSDKLSLNNTRQQLEAAKSRLAAAEIQVAYTIGRADPVSVKVGAFSTGVVSSQELTEIVKKEFDLRPAAIIERLNLLRPIYRKTSNYGHFGRERPEFVWEKTDMVGALKKAVK